MLHKYLCRRPIKGPAMKPQKHTCLCHLYDIDMFILHPKWQLDVFSNEKVTIVAG